MPELPEVETIRRGLEKKIVGLSIREIKILSPKSFIGNPELVLNKKIVSVKRRAKILVMDLEGELSIIFHLKMSGQVIFESSGKKLPATSNRLPATRFIGGHPTKDMFGGLPNKHTRVIFEFNNNSHLYFNDLRKFGWVKVVADEEVKREVERMFGRLGPEPLEKEFNWEVLKKNLLKHKTMPVKVAILDQSVVSGIGNIYANEACFYAGIEPKKRVLDLNDQQIKNLQKGIVAALEKGVEHKGSTLANFVDDEGNKGYFLDYAYVYGRDKKPCKNCGTAIKKLQLNGRGTYFCINCQK
jgi:formamidopyrimidine-DNA glycosylase